MAPRVNRGEIWLYTFGSPDKRRPVLVLSRQKAIGLLRTVLVAPITSAAHGAPSEVQVGIEEGLKHDSVVNLDQVQSHSMLGEGGCSLGTVAVPAEMVVVG